MLDTRKTEAKRLMLRFAQDSGVLGNAAPRRYLWTDAHAVCNFLSLLEWEADPRWLELAQLLVAQVHQVLGRHRPDDRRSGWISGLSAADGEQHPTIGGLRIGKPLPERAADARVDERGEWDQDGQYYHYLTKWMHALARLSVVTEDTKYLRWAIELACTACRAFRAPSGPARLHWKMSIDLSYPLVSASGQHDPLDGMVTALALHERAEPKDAEALHPVIADLAMQCRGRTWTTDDPLGIGGLLFDAARISHLTSASGRREGLPLLEGILVAAEQGLQSFYESGALSLPAAHRLAFRELGLTIGLQCMEAMAARPLPASVMNHTERLRKFAGLRGPIEQLWLLPDQRRSRSWLDHDDINNVMLATSLAPENFLKI